MAGFLTSFNPKDYVGAKVLRTCTIMGKRRLPGEILSSEELQSMSPANLRAFIGNNYAMPMFAGAETKATPKGKRYLVRRSDLRFDVVQGVLVNDEPLSKAEAEALAKETRQ